MKIHIYRKKNKKSKSEKTKISISFKGKNQIPLFMIVREYYNKKTKYNALFIITNINNHFA